MDFIEKLLPFLANGGAGGAIALALIWYLKARDAAGDSMRSKNTGDFSQVTDALSRIAAAVEKTADSQERCERILERCADGHAETQLELREVKTAITYLSKPNGKSPFAK